MQQFRREGKSLHWIARQMELLGVKTKNGGRWYAKTVSQILELNVRNQSRLITDL